MTTTWIFVTILVLTGIGIAWYTIHRLLNSENRAAALDAQVKAEQARLDALNAQRLKTESEQRAKEVKDAEDISTSRDAGDFLRGSWGDDNLN